MEKQIYITKDERERCQGVADAFAELYEKEDIVVLDAGGYGFVKLQYYKQPFGFDDVVTFTDSIDMFNDLWEEWLDTQLLNIAKDTPMLEMDYDDIFKCLPSEKQKELMDKRVYFAKQAEIDINALEQRKKEDDD